MGKDVAHIIAHDRHQTHLDAINHIGRNGKWYNGFAVDDPEGPDLAGLTDHGLFTPGVLVDIPAVRGTEWVDPAKPVTGEDIDSALAAAGVTFEPGDALLLYMGRDKYEAAGKVMDVFGGIPTPGAGSGAARWLVEHKASMICWDFIDAVAEGEPSFQVHMLIWATGMLLVDNCTFARAAEAVRGNGVITGDLVVAPSRSLALLGHLSIRCSFSSDHPVTMGGFRVSRDREFVCPESTTTRALPIEPVQYTAIRYTERLDEAKAVRSVGSKGDSYDNAAAQCRLIKLLGETGGSSAGESCLMFFWSRRFMGNAAC